MKVKIVSDQNYIYIWYVYTYIYIYIHIYVYFESIWLSYLLKRPSKIRESCCNKNYSILFSGLVILFSTHCSSTSNPFNIKENGSGRFVQKSTFYVVAEKRKFFFFSLVFATLVHLLLMDFWCFSFSLSLFYSITVSPLALQNLLFKVKSWHGQIVNVHLGAFKQKKTFLFFIFGCYLLV